MKFIFIIRLSEDGVFQEAYTNIKAMFEGIKKTNYTPITIDQAGIDEVTYNYPNLVKAVRLAQQNNRSHIASIECEADAQANRLRQQSLTPLLIQQQFIEKWNGALPTYGQVPQIFKGIQ